MSQLSDLYHKIQVDLSGGLSYAGALKVVADLKAQVPVAEADLQLFATYLVNNAAVEEGVLTELIAFAPGLGVPAAVIVVLEGLLVAIKAIVASEAVGSDAVQALLAGFATLNQSWATRAQDVFNAIGIK